MAIKKIYNHPFDNAHFSVSYADEEAISLECSDTTEMWLNQNDVIAMAEHFNLELTQK